MPTRPGSTPTLYATRWVGIDSVVVTDDGLGMTAAEARQAFGALGGSWKRKEQLTRRDRRMLHGDEGKGRYSAFSIGEHVRWGSVAALDDGSREQVAISGTRSTLRVFDIPDP